MIIPLLLLYIGLIPLRSSAVLVFNLSGDIAVGRTVGVQWAAENFDPIVFTLAVGQNAGAVDKFATVNRTGGKLEGPATTPPLRTPGTYFIVAFSTSGNPLGTSKGFKVTGLPGSSTQLSSLSSSNTLQTIQSSTPTETLPITKGSITLISSNPAPIQLSTKSAAIAGPLSGGKSFQTNVHHLVVGIIHERVIALTGRSSSSIVMQNPSPTNSSFSTTSRRPSNIAVILGSIVGAIAVLAVIIFVYVMRRRRRSGLPYSAVSPYVPPNIGARSPFPRSVFASRKRHLNLRNTPPDITATSPGIPFEKHRIKRQRDLRDRVIDIERQPADSEASLNNVPDASSELTRAVISENIRLTTEIQVLRDLNRSNWALGVTDVPPPSYAHIQVSEQ
ncbi:hypothetical protein C8J56DRAFT_946056 [Mycena floridula]|nr:hypothetical protein C8J56DRAFT_946056 [Mycena floridula]